MKHFYSKTAITALVATLALAGGLWCASSSQAQPNDAAAAVVRSYLRNVSNNNMGANAKLFIGPKAPIVGISGGAGLDQIWVENSQKIIKDGEETAQYQQIIDTLETQQMDNALATVTVRYHSAPYRVNSRAVFTLTSEGGTWKIASLVFETRLP